MINFSINKTLFFTSIKYYQKSWSVQNAIPILSMIKIDVTPEGVALSGSNGQISIENFISIKDENAGLLGDLPGSILLKQLSPMASLLRWLLRF